MTPMSRGKSRGGLGNAAEKTMRLLARENRSASIHYFSQINDSHKRDARLVSSRGHLTINRNVLEQDRRFAYQISYLPRSKIKRIARCVNGRVFFFQEQMPAGNANIEKSALKRQELSSRQMYSFLQARLMRAFDVSVSENTADVGYLN